MNWPELGAVMLGSFGGAFFGAAFVAAVFKAVEIVLATRQHHEMMRHLNASHQGMVEQIDAIIASRMLDRRGVS